MDTDTVVAAIIMEKGGVGKTTVALEAKLDELRSYLYANRESVRGYAEAYRNGERISTAHVE